MTTSLTIGIDARAASEVPAGRGRLVRELIDALAAREDPHRYLLYARTPWRRELDERFAWVCLDAPDPLWHWRTARAADRDCDVFLATNSYLSAIFAHGPTVTLVYDLVALDPATSPNRRSAVIERLTLDFGVRRSRVLVCISQATADALLARIPTARPRTALALLGASDAPQPAGAEELAALPQPGFVLAVGTLEPRKNLPRLVEAYASLAQDVQEAHPLVVVGAQGWRAGATLSALESLGSRCLRLGYVSDGALVELYRRCAVFCYPSIAEGFGLPVLEAMRAGAPVITSNVSSLPEVGGDAPEYVDPLDVSDVARGIAAVLGDPARREQMIARGRVRAAEFSWDAFAAAVLDALMAAA